MVVNALLKMSLLIGLSFLLFLEFDCVAVGIPRQKSFAESHLSGLIRNHARRDKMRFAGDKFASCPVRVVRQQNGVAVDNVVGMLVRWEGFPIPWCKVFEQLDPGTAAGAKCRDA